MERRTLTLKKPDPATRPKVDPAKVGLSEKLGIRFVDRGGRYIFQHLVVAYEERETPYFNERLQITLTHRAEISRTWVDVPLVPEAYCG